VGAECENRAQSAAYRKEHSMTSILTNTSAMNALQTLKNTNVNLNKTQQEIASGKSIASARDNAAVWAISKVMDSDVKGFEQISNSLALGQSTLGVARGAAESVTDLLTEIKQLVVGAQEENVDRAKIQTDINRLTEQVESIVGAAQFNGLNLLQNTDDTAGSGTVNILGSLDRAADGTVTARNVAITKQDLQTTAQSVDTGGTYVNNAATATLNATSPVTLSLGTITAGVAYSLGSTATDADSSAFVPADYSTTDSAAGAAALSYVARDGDTAEDVARELVSRWNTANADMDTSVLSFSVTGTGANAQIQAASSATDGTDTIAVRLATITSTDNVIGGGLEALDNIDVTTTAGATSALAAIEGLIQTGIDASAAFGSAEKRIDIQADFVSRLTDSLKAGIGTLVDADMEEASARLQALQVQQQLGVQALSIANQSPQTLLSLFR
jgi:flagellin